MSDDVSAKMTGWTFVHGPDKTYLDAAVDFEGHSGKVQIDMKSHQALSLGFQMLIMVWATGGSGKETDEDLEQWQKLVVSLLRQVLDQADSLKEVEKVLAMKDRHAYARHMKALFTEIGCLFIDEALDDPDD